MTFMMRPSVLGPTGTRICEPVAVTLLATGQAVSRVHGDRADDVLAEVLGDLEHQALALIVGFKRGQDRRKLAFESDVDDSADDLRDLADEIAACGRRLGAGALVVAAFLVRVLGSAAVAMFGFLAFSCPF